MNELHRTSFGAPRGLHFYIKKSTILWSREGGIILHHDEVF